MPDRKAQATMQRQLLVLVALQKLSGPQKKWVTVADIVKALGTDGYNAEIHSVRRDLEALMDTYYQVERNDNSRGEGPPARGLAYGYRWQGSASAPETGLSLGEALSLVLVERYLNQVLPSTLTTSLKALFNTAAHTLDIHKTSPAAHWPEKIAVIPPAQPLIPPHIDTGVQQAIHEALIEEKQLRVVYGKSGRDATQESVLHPLGLIQRGPAAYLAAMAWHYEDVRLYALHRIREAVKLANPCRKLPGFDIAHYAEEQGHFGSGEPIRLVARVSPRLKRILDETKLADDQVFSGPEDNGWYELQAMLRNTWQLRWWVLGHIEDMVVLEPSHLNIQNLKNE